MDLDEDLALTVQRGEDVAALVGDGQLHHGVQGPEPLRQRFEELVGALAGDGRDRHRPAGP